MRILSCTAILALTACTAAPVKKYEVEDAKKMIGDPDKLLDYLMTQILAAEFAPAYEYALSPATKAGMSYELFYFGVTREVSGFKPLELEITRRLLADLRQHELRVVGMAATAKWCSAGFAFSYPVRLTQTPIGRKRLWGYDFTPEELRAFIEAAQGAALAWFRHQKKVADGKLYTYPPDWHHTPLGTACGCAR